jgi:hypothetical protein
MALKLNLGQFVELDADGDLAKYLQPGLDNILNFDPTVIGALSSAVADLPSGSVSTNFNFSSSPSWTIAQTVGITLSVKPAASCTLAILKPGDTLFSYAVGEGGKDTPVKAPADTYYISIALDCSIAVDAGAKWSSGNLGVSGSVSTSDQFRVANYYAVGPAVTLRDAIAHAFSSFVLPFHGESVQKLTAGEYVDFEFAGKLALGFGATYGFSGLFFAGRSNGEVTASFASPVGKTVVKAAPSYQVGASFKVQYTHSDAFRVVAGRTATGATLYLLKKDASQISTTETLGITLSAGASFQTDASTVKTEAQTAAQAMLGPQAGSILGGKLAAAADQAVGEINSAVNKLLQKADGQKIALELTQSTSRENTALFIYDFDFSTGTGAYTVAMQGDYVRALTMPGVTLDPRSYVEQLYVKSAGLHLQLFSLLDYKDVTQYVQSTDITYVGARTFQVRKTAGVKSISGLFGKDREADLYFIAQCLLVEGSPNVSDVTVRLNAIFIDRDNASAFRETEATLAALGVADAQAAVGSYVARQPKGTVQFTLDVDTALLGAIDSDDYQANGKPEPEPHPKDTRNYEQFVKSAVAVIGPLDTVAQLFEERFATYADWLKFNQTVTDQPGSTRPGDRLAVMGTNAQGQPWPEGYTPSDATMRLLVQTYILAGQSFMNFCAGIKQLVTAVPGAQTEAQYDALYNAVAGMVRKETPFPTYFLKPSIVALVGLARVGLTAGTLPDPAASGTFAVTLKAVEATAAAARAR